MKGLLPSTFNKPLLFSLASLTLPRCWGSVCPRRDVHWPRRDEDRPHHCAILRPPLSWVKRAEQCFRPMTVAVRSAVLVPEKEVHGLSTYLEQLDKMEFGKHCGRCCLGAQMPGGPGMHEREWPSSAWRWHWNSVLRPKKSLQVRWRETEKYSKKKYSE